MEREVIVPTSVQVKIRCHAAIQEHNDQTQLPPPPPAAAAAAAVDSTSSKSAEEVVLNDNKMTMDRWIRIGGLGRLTWSILAAQRCRPAVEAIQRQERQRLVDHILEEMTIEGGGKGQD